jgi:hypothetical protein
MRAFRRSILPAVIATDGAIHLVQALEGFPEETKRILPWLVEGLSTGKDDFFMGAIQAIEGPGTEGKAALPQLLELVRKAKGGTAVSDARSAST